MPNAFSERIDSDTGKWLVCFMLFAATTINYMDRSVFSLVEPTLHTVPFMGWNPLADSSHQHVFDQNYGNIVIAFQIAYGAGLLIAGRVVDKLGSKLGYAMAVLLWTIASISHAWVGSVMGFVIARIALGIGESGNFPSAIKATAECFPTEQRALVTGLINSGANVSYFIAPLVVSVSLDRWGWQSTFLTTGLFGFVWLAAWLMFPYNRIKRNQATITQQYVALPEDRQKFTALLSSRRAWSFAVGKGLTDGVWWFYLFYLPLFLNRNYGLSLANQYWFLVAVYITSGVGSILGGALPGWMIQRGMSINASRKIALLAMAICVVPIVLVPAAGHAFPTNPWPAVACIAIAAAAHQGWSSNLFSTIPDMFPVTSVSTVVGFGGAVGSIGAAIFTAVVKNVFSQHQSLVFTMSGSAYLIAIAIIHFLVPRMGVPQNQRQHS